jgi:hypothetical protein
MPKRWKIATVGLVSLLFAFQFCFAAQDSLPNPSTTPGVADPTVTQSNISTTICRSGYAAAVRPPEEVSEAIKHRQLEKAGIPDERSPEYEEDHLIPLELGGAAADEQNLWPQPRHPKDGWEAVRKDDLERALRAEVCSGKMSLADAQRAIVSDWHGAWQRRIGDQPLRPPRRVAAMTAPNDNYYRSGDGSFVHGPTIAPGDFGKVMAICADGSRSFSHTRRGTCSHHGGVASWR